MNTEITEAYFLTKDQVINESLTSSLSYYDKVNKIIKRTHAAMGRTVPKSVVSAISSTTNGKIHKPTCSATR